MKYIYHVKQNSDLTEGRGPMVSVTFFEQEEDAIKFCETRAKRINYGNEKWQGYGLNKEIKCLGFLQYTKELVHEKEYDEEQENLKNILKKITPDELVLLRKHLNEK